MLVVGLVDGATRAFTGTSFLTADVTGAGNFCNDAAEYDNVPAEFAIGAGTTGIGTAPPPNDFADCSLVAEYGLTFATGFFANGSPTRLATDGATPSAIDVGTRTGSRRIAPEAPPDFANKEAQLLVGGAAAGAGVGTIVAAVSTASVTGIVCTSDDCNVTVCVGGWNSIEWI